MLLAGSAVAQQPGDIAKLNRRSADTTWTQLKAQQDAVTEKLKQSLHTWDELYAHDKAKYDASKEGIGRYGHAMAELDTYPRRPSSISGPRIIDLESALNAKRQQLESIEVQRRDNQYDEELYGDDVRATVAVNSLELMLANARLSDVLNKRMELCQLLKLAVASSVSREVFSETLDQIKRDLDSLYELGQRDDESTQRLMQLFLKY